ncbi:MAG: M48 family metalloprotease [Deltaproteobacteria bacterium]|nr:M48 family metalloprotease [Deltaproteobacteria bacterium]
MNALEELLATGAKLEQFFTPAYVAKAQAYVQPLRIKGLADEAFKFVTFALIFTFRLHVRVHAACARFAGRLAAQMQPGGVADRYRKLFERVWKGPGLGAGALFILAMTVIWTLLDLPEAVYFDFLREKREGLSHYTALSFSWDISKGLLLDAAVQTLGILALYALMRHLPRAWAPVLGVVGALALLVSPLFDPARQRVYYSYAPLQDGPVRSAVLDVLKKGGVQFQDVVVENMSRTTSRGDAFFAGQGPTRLIVVGDTLLNDYAPEEISLIVAHEMGHLSEPVWPPRLLSAFTLLLALLGLKRLLALCARKRWFGLETPDDLVGYQLMWFAVAVVMGLLAPISSWRSRVRESEADAYALQLTNDPSHFASMMAKLTAQNRFDPIPPAWAEAWHAGHPAPARRLAMAVRYAHEHGIALALPPPQDAK